MLSQIEGSQAVARAVAACRPQVIPAYPISPQTHIVEGLAELLAAETLQGCRFVTVESEFGAMSMAIGASAMGSRTYTATSSQGLLFMAEALYNAAGLGLPIVMTVANRAIGAPINIWNDQSDSLSQRDSGWIQLYARDNQHAADLHVLAFRLAEQVSVPVMVCVDGFVLTHAVERIDVPEQQQVDSYLPAFQPRIVLDPAQPYTIGAMVGPEAFTEVRILAQDQMQQAVEAIPVLTNELSRTFARDVPGLLAPYRLDDAKLVLVTLGSTWGTLADVVDSYRDRGHAVGGLGLVAFRPFPDDALREALAGASRVVVLERAFSTGAAGIVSPEIRNCVPAGVPVHTAVVGLGGRPVTEATLAGVADRALSGELPLFDFADQDSALLQRARAQAAVGPIAERVLHQARRVSAGSDR
jgi:pyruvate ferredoxin oxidoreductase alpha subunit